MPRLQDRTSLPHMLRAATSAWFGRAAFLLVFFLTMPAFAGNSGSAMGQGVTDMMDELIDFMTGPVVIGGATIMFILALVGGYFAGGNDTIKKVLTVVAITAAIIAAPGIVTQVVTSAGAVL